MKVAYFVGTARKDLAHFPETAQRRAGHEPFMVQVGRTRRTSNRCQASDLGLTKSVGRSRGISRDLCGKIRGRRLHPARVSEKTRGTPTADIGLAARRYKLIVEE